MPLDGSTAKCLAKINDKVIRGLLMTVGPDRAELQNILEQVPDVKMMSFHRLDDVHDLFVFLMLNRTQRVLLDTGNFFKTASPSLTQKAAHMIARALDGSVVHSYSSTRTFLFEGQIILATHCRELVPYMARNRMYVC